MSGTRSYAYFCVGSSLLVCLEPSRPFTINPVTTYFSDVTALQSLPSSYHGSWRHAYFSSLTRVITLFGGSFSSSQDRLKSRTEKFYSSSFLAASKQSYFYFSKLGDKCRSYFIFIPLNAAEKIQKTWEHSKFPHFVKSLDKTLCSL